MRAFTKREKVIKFSGCYHGHADSFLVAAGSGVATLGLPDSPGVPASSVGAQPGWRSASVHACAACAGRLCLVSWRCTASKPCLP